MPTPHPSRSLTALGRAAVLWRESRPGHVPPAPKPWEMPKHRRGQVAGEVYAFAAVVGVLTFALLADLVARIVPLGGWHWLWIAPLLVPAWFVLLHVAGTLCTVVGRIAAGLGILARRRPSERAGFWFLALLTAAAAHAAAGGGWIAVPAGAWLALACLNTAAFVWCAMKSSEP